MQDNANDISAAPPEEQPSSAAAPANSTSETAPYYYYYVRSRVGIPALSAASRISGLTRNEVVMIQTDHGPEPATVAGPGPDFSEEPDTLKGRVNYSITRRASHDEIDKFENLLTREADAHKTCQAHIARHNLGMKLSRVERYFNGSKIIFYFTAENRVDFRELVKDLVQEFRTRVEIRQIGVRHETKMVGGIGCCGRELCCASFIKDFAPVSIKMAKEQNLPLNPTKISGVCNRLLCCLTYEYDTYHALRKGMPKPGRALYKEGVELKVIQTNVLKGTVTVVPISGGSDGLRVLTKPEWEPLLAAPAVARTATPPAAPPSTPAADSRQARPPKARARRQKPKRREGSEAEAEGREGQANESGGESAAE